MTLQRIEPLFKYTLRSSTVGSAERDWCPTMVCSHCAASFLLDAAILNHTIKRSNWYLFNSNQPLESKKDFTFIISIISTFSTTFQHSHGLLETYKYLDDNRCWLCASYFWQHRPVVLQVVNPFNCYERRIMVRQSSRKYYLIEKYSKFGSLR